MKQSTPLALTREDRAPEADSTTPRLAMSSYTLASLMSSPSTESTLSSSQASSLTSSNSTFAFSPSSPSGWSYSGISGSPSVVNDSTTGTSGVVRQGPVSVKEDGTSESWMWKSKWVVLKELSLSLHKSENSPQQSVILLRDIAKIGRTDLKPYCLLLETQDKKRWFLSFKNDEDLYGWQDDVHSRSPLMSVSNPADFSSGAFTGMPDQWSKLLTKSGITRDDYAKDPQAVLDMLEFYTDHQKREMERETDTATERR